MNEKELFCFKLMVAIEDNANKIKTCADDDREIKVVSLMQAKYSFSDEELMALCNMASFSETVEEELKEIIEGEVGIYMIRAECHNGHADISLAFTC